MAALVRRQHSTQVGRGPTPNRQQPLSWLVNCNGDLIWSAIVLVAVLLPLASLTLDVPRYFVLRSRLQLAADAAAVAAAQCVVIPHFQNTGETILDEWCVLAESDNVFVNTVMPMRDKGYGLALTHVNYTPDLGTITVYAQGDMPIFFALTPRLAVQVQATSGYRMLVK